MDKWHARGWLGDHAELWTELAVLLRRRAHGQVRFVKVKGHAKDAHVAEGFVTQEDKDGNDAADLLATAAADAHAAPEALVQHARRRKQVAAATHRMMLRILHARSGDKSVRVDLYAWYIRTRSPSATSKLKTKC